MKIIEAKDYDELSKIAGDIVLAQIREKHNSVLGLATGSTPIGMYEYIVEAHKKGDISFAAVTTFNLDEYVGLDGEHPNSYSTYMDTYLFDHIDIPKANMHIPNGVALDAEAECTQYEAKIVQSGDIDLQVLGIGIDGHIGFNEPFTPFTSKTHLVQLHETTREVNQRFFDSLDEVPTHAYTMGIDTIMRSKHILLLISGSSKAEIVARLLNESVTEEIPASVLKNHPHVTLVIDRDALSKTK